MGCCGKKRRAAEQAAREKREREEREKLERKEGESKSIGPRGIRADVKEKQPPSLNKRIKNLAEAVYKHITTGSKVVDTITYIERLKLCRTCEELIKIKICSICGCYVKTKCRWADQECPLDPPKWVEVKD